jgi:hypothetical protein
VSGTGTTGFGPNQQFAAAQRCVSCQRRTRRSGGLAGIAAPARPSTPTVSYESDPAPEKTRKGTNGRARCSPSVTEEHPP